MIRIANDNKIDVQAPEIESLMMGPSDALARFIYWLGIGAPEQIRLAYQNFQTLPPGLDQYIIITDLGRRRVGRSCERFDPVTEKIQICEYTEITLQIDVFDTILEKAIEKAQRIDAVALTEHGVKFFNRYGLSCLYAEDVRPSAIDAEDGLFLGRATTTLHLGAWFKVELPTESFDMVDVRCRLANK